MCKENPKHAYAYTRMQTPAQSMRTHTQSMRMHALNMHKYLGFQNTCKESF